MIQILENLLFPKKKGKADSKEKDKLFFGKVIWVFLFTTFAWVFFRAETFEDAIYVIGHMFDGIGQPAVYFSFSQLYTYLGLDLLTLLGMICSVAILTVFDYISLKKDVLKSIGQRKLMLRWAIYICFIIFIIFHVPVTSGQEFIYFQF